jgi:Plavaka transposase
VDIPSDQKTYRPFDNHGQWRLAHHVLFPTPFTAARLKAAISINSPWNKPECAFANYADFKRRVALIPKVGGAWRAVLLNPKNGAPLNASINIKLWYRDSLEILKSLLADKRTLPHMMWAPHKLFNSKGERLYSELWSGDWWWKLQAFPIQTIRLLIIRSS